MTLKITYLSPYFWPEEIGSAPYCTDLAVWLRSKGNDVGVLSFRPHYPTPEQFHDWADGSRDREEYQDVVIERIAAGERGSGCLRNRFKNDLRYFLRVLYSALVGQVHRRGAIVAYVPSILCLLAGVLIGKMTGVRVIAIVHDIESGLARSLAIAKRGPAIAILRFVERLSLNGADEVVVLTPAMKSEIENIGCRRPINVIPIWAELPPHSPGASGKCSVLMYSGNFGKKQNLDQILPLIAKLAAERSDIRIILQGDGSERPRIEAAVGAISGANVEFRSLVPGSLLMQSLQSANIHLVTQAMGVGSYALPSKLISIMAAGRPFVCVAKKGSTIDEIAVKSGAGISVQPGDPDALYDVVVRLSRNVALQRSMGECGRQYVKENMDRELLLSRFEQLIVGQGNVEHTH
jgi:colanic acid biosynthesis glycosyl transferase WcaI